MLEFKTLGVIMIFPTMALAVYLVYKTLNTRDFYINMSIFFWIGANSFWMLMEFFNDNQYKHYAGIPFALGILFVVLFYLKNPAKSEIQA